MIVEYTNKEIMDKLNNMHTDIRVTNGTVKAHTKLIYGAYTFTFTLLLVIIGVAF